MQNVHIPRYEIAQKKRRDAAKRYKSDTSLRIIKRCGEMENYIDETKGK